jgi:hypothetical protein
VDRYTFRALDTLRNQGLYGNAAEPPQRAPRSIDGGVEQAVDQAEARMRRQTEFLERWHREHLIDGPEEKELPTVPTKPCSAVGEGSGPVLIPHFSVLSLS